MERRTQVQMSNLLDANCDNVDRLDGTISSRIRRRLEAVLDEELAREKRTWSYYEEMRKRDPKTYWQERTQRQLYKDLDELQEKFLDDEQR